MILKLNESNSYELFDEFNDIHKRLWKDKGANLPGYKLVIPARSIESGYYCLLFIGDEKRPTEVAVRVLDDDF